MTAYSDEYGDKDFLPCGNSSGMMRKGITTHSEKLREIKFDFTCD